MVKRLLYLLPLWAVCLFVSCSQELLETGDVSQLPEVEQTVAGSRLTLSASMEESGTRTELGQGGTVLWSAGDAFRIANEWQGPALQVELSAGNAALGLSCAKATTARVRYSSAQVLAGGSDVTEAWGLQPAGGERQVDIATYKSGFMNLTTNYVVPLVSVPSGVSFTGSATVTFRGLAYSINNGSSWTEVTSSTAFLNGSVWGNADAAFSWLQPSYLRMVLDGEGGATSGIFRSDAEAPALTPDATALAVYPYDALTDYSEGKLTLAVPEIQEYQQQTFDRNAHLMVGHVPLQAIGSVRFRNLMGMLQLSLTGQGAVLSHVTITDVAGQMLWGTAILPVSQMDGGISTSMLTGGSSTLTLRCPGVVLGEEPVTFHVLVPQGAFSGGLQVTVHANDGTACKVETTQQNTILRNQLRQMPAVVMNRFLYELNLHNVAVERYLSYADKPAFTVRSHFTTHSDLKDNSLINQDLPQVFHLTWEGSSGSAYTVSLTDVTRQRTVYAKRPVTGTSYDIINLVPGHEYSYLVEEGSQVIKQGGILAQGLVREVIIADSWNYRDIGGWTGLGGHPVAYEWIYRGGSLNGTWTGTVSNTNQSASSISTPSKYVFSAQGQEQLQDLGIKGELDLRNIPSESSNKSDKTHAYSLNLNNTGLTDWEFKRIATSNALSNPTQYHALVRDVAWIIHQVVDEGKPIAFHCKSGADRTGAVALTLLAILGVDPGDIAREYELTLYSHEQSVVIGKNEFRDRNAQSGEVATFFGAVTKAISQPTLQETFYYYLNRYFSAKGVAISCTDLDRFIEKMLGLPAGSYQHPSWAVETSYTLQEIYEKTE